jgi:uncharacterized protein YacL
VGLILSLELAIKIKDAQEKFMSDVVLIVITLVFIVLGLLYLKGCERLK